jgi:ribonuclease HI
MAEEEREIKANAEYTDESQEEGLPHLEMKPFVLHLEEHVLQQIRALAETKDTDPHALVKEFVVEGLNRAEKSKGLPDPTFEKRYVHNKRTVEIYTDGGCRGNPGPGSWAAIIYEGPKPKEIYGAEKSTTNQRMELQAAIEGLLYLKEPSRVRLYSDSAYLLNALNEGWLTTWEHNGWKKADKKPVKNADLWEELLKVARFHEVKWIKVSGHSGNPGNERCHSLVQIAIDRAR